MRNCIIVIILLATLQLASAQTKPAPKSASLRAAAPCAVLPRYYPIFIPSSGYGFGFLNLDHLPWSETYWQPQLLQQPANANSIPTPAIRNLTSANAEAELLAKAEISAKLTMSVPFAAIWQLDGKPVSDNASLQQEFTSEPSSLNTNQTFKVSASWKQDGKDYQVEKRVSVRAGEHARITVYAGTLVK